jgi:uncharacterized protein YndB with AHSA1/START domain
MSRSVVKEVFIAAPPDEVWRALTDARELTQWFPVEARVTPGLGGSIWISWGDGASGEAPITAWEPGRRFEWTEERGPVKLAVDFRLEPRDNGTVVRLVQSGFGDGPEWDDEFHMVTGGWAYFMTHLQWYLERHRGVPRELIGRRDKVALSRADAFARLLALVANFETTSIVMSPATCQAGFTIAALNDAILFIEVEPGRDSCRAGFWLSTYGLGERFGSVRAHLNAAYDSALGLSQEKQP